MQSLIEEYQKGSDYAPIFEGYYNNGIKCILIKDGKKYKAGKARNCEWYCVNTGNTWLHGAREWFVDNGYKEEL